MNNALRFGTAIGALALTANLGGCAASHQPKSASIFGGKVDNENIGLATRAQLALGENKLTEAVALAERAVAASPNDAGFRGLLGNCYFAGGRFASAEAAYRDSLTLLSNQPQVVLKMALVSVAQGKNGQAIAFLDAAKDVLDPSDYGLALALAGRPQQAADYLQTAAQQTGADSRVRQNLALALAFSGDWVAARSVAAQDVPADQLDARIQQWMQLAKPARASDQIASLMGIAPVAMDPGQPIRLALRDAKSRLAAAVPIAPVAEAAPTEVAEVAPASPVVATPEMAAPAPVILADANPVPLVVERFVAKPVRHVVAPRPSLSPRASVMADARTLYRHAAAKNPARGSSVVQLGAYSSRASVAAAWSRVSHKFGSLRGYAPVAARFDGERGTVYRLSVHGFGSSQQAQSLCGSLKRAGGACFVRNVAGDAPVRIASL